MKAEHSSTDFELFKQTIEATFTAPLEKCHRKDRTMELEKFLICIFLNDAKPDYHGITLPYFGTNVPIISHNSDII